MSAKTLGDELHDAQAQAEYEQEMSRIASMRIKKSALDKLLESTSDHWPTLTPKARAELAQLREADIRTMEHCDECGDLLMLDADAPEDAVPYCPSCELDKTRYESQRRLEDLEAIEKKCAALRAQVALLDDYSAAIRAHEITLAEQARELEEARELLKQPGVCDMLIWSWWENKVNAWLSAHPAPSDEAEPQP